MKRPSKNRLAILLNGPPQVGKDTLAELIPLPKATLADIPRAEAAKYYDYVDEFFYLASAQETKNVVHPALGKTPRQALIDFAEQVAKPTRGSDCFAKQFAEEQTVYHEFVMTDLGFPVEAEELAKKFDLVITVQLEREGCSFENDSRTYVDSVASNNPVIRFDNNWRGDEDCVDKAKQLRAQIEAEVEKHFR